MSAPLDPFALARAEPVATAEEMAALEFEPWPKAQAEVLLEILSNPHFDKNMQQIGIDLRISATLLQKTKDELVTVATDLGEDTLTLIKRLQDTGDWLKEMRGVADAAFARLVCAAHCVWPEEPEKG